MSFHGIDLERPSDELVGSAALAALQFYFSSFSEPRRLVAYVKVETSVARNRKFQIAGPAASWLWLCGNLYCQDGLTDGFIPEESLPYLGVKNARQFVPHLVKARLWHEVEGGWQVNDYLKSNKAAADVRELQEERRAIGSKGGKASGLVRRATDEANSFTAAKQVASATAKQTVNPEAEADQKTEAVHPASPSRPTKPATLVQPRRKDAAWEGPRVYVPQRAHADFLAFRGGASAERELLAWYESVSDAWSPGGARASEEPGADMFAFWKARYAERWPAATAARGEGRDWVTRGKAARS